MSQSAEFSRTSQLAGDVIHVANGRNLSRSGKIVSYSFSPRQKCMRASANINIWIISPTRSDKNTSNCTKNKMSPGAKTLFHKIGEKVPPELAGAKDLFLSALVPRALAWLSVDDERVSLLEGLTGAAYTPPSLYFAARAIPPDVLQRLRQTKVCTLSSATERDPKAAFAKAGTAVGATPQSFTFEQLGLKGKKTKQDYPAVVEHAPIHMHCTVDKIVDLDDKDQALVVLLVNTFVMDGSVLSEPTDEMKKRPNVTAKIDAQLIKPVVGLGQGRICGLKTLHSMPRPVKQMDGTWTSTEFNIAAPTTGPFGFPTTEWTFKEHGGTCPLGYNALTALIMPRPIGWISTYRKDGLVPHIAPYSFFSDVARGGDKPMVAFSGYRRNGETPKDAEQDAIDTGCFAFNMVAESLAVPMNLSAAEIASEDSEFALSGLSFEPAHSIHAPVVSQSPVRFECKYVKSVPIGSFSIVLGEVVSIAVSDSVISAQDIDPVKLNAIMRLGFMDEYGTLDV